MISDNAKTIIREHFNELPKLVQDVILNSNWEAKIRRIVENNKLHIDQGAALENLVFVTMLGMETPEDFVDNAKEYANLSDEQAYSISMEVEREIFGEIRRALVKMTETANTVDDIGRVTDELSKVAGDIEDRAKYESDQSYDDIKRQQGLIKDEQKEDTLVIKKKTAGPVLDVSTKGNSLLSLKAKKEERPARTSLKESIPVGYFKEDGELETLESRRSEDAASTPKAAKVETPDPVVVNKDPYHEPIAVTDADITINRTPKEPIVPLGTPVKKPTEPVAIERHEDDPKPVAVQSKALSIVEQNLSEGSVAKKEEVSHDPYREPVVV